MSTQLARAHHTVTSQLRANMIRMLRLTWAGSMFDLSDRSAELWIRSAVPLIRAHQAEMIRAETAYLSMVIGGDVPRLDLGRMAYVRPVDIHDVYHRPVVTARSVRAAGWETMEALRRGLNRAENIATTDLQLVKTHTAQAVLSNSDNVVGYRRVLTGNESCGLCMAASTRRYHKADLMPIHPGCDCGVAPLIGTEDPGTVINNDQLQALHRQGVEPERTIIYEHGEIGPTLAVEGHRHLTGDDPDDRADVAPPPDDQAA